MTFGVADASFPRIDVVALQFDKAANETNLVIKQGTAASSPAIPAIVQTEVLYELYLYAVRRSAGATVVLASDVTDLRPDEQYCGLMRDGVTRDQAVPDGTVTTEKFSPDAKAPFAALADEALNGVYQLSASKSGTVFALSGLSGKTGIVSCVFTAPADYAKGNTVTVDGTTYTVKLQDGSEPSDMLFASGATVACVINTGARTVNFKSSGGSRKHVIEYTTASYSADYTDTFTLEAVPQMVTVIIDGKFVGALVEEGETGIWKHGIGTLSSSTGTMNWSGKTVTIVSSSADIRSKSAVLTWM